jgi:hypothetical protein
MKYIYLHVVMLTVNAYVCTHYQPHKQHDIGYKCIFLFYSCLFPDKGAGILLVCRW